MPGIQYTIDFAASIARLEDGTKRAASSVKRMADDMESATTFARNAVMALAAALGVHEFKEWISGAAEAGDQAGKTSDRFGILTEKLVGMQYAVALAGGQNESFTTALRSMNSAALEAAQGSAEMQNVFRLLGLDAQTFLSLPVDQQFETMIDRLHGMENAGLRNAVAQKALGRSYGELMGIIAEGSGALRKAQDDAEAFGTAITRVDAAKLEIANDAMKRAQEASKGLGTTIAIAVAPVVKLLADRFSDAAFESRGFRDQVAEGMQTATTAVAGGIFFVERLQFAYAALKYGAGLAIDGIIQALAGLDRAYTDTMNSLANSWVGKRLGMEAREYSATLQEMAAVSANRVGELKDELDRLANTAKTLDEWKTAVSAAFARAREAVQREAEQIAAARQSFNASATLPELKDDTAYQQALAKRLEQVQLGNLSEMQLLDAHLLEQQNTLDVARARDLISEEQYQAQKAELVRRYALQRQNLERQQYQSLQTMQFQNVQYSIELLQQFAGHNKAAAIAAIALQKGLAAATVIVMTEAAIAQAWARGPEVGAVLEAKLRTQEAISLALIAATGLVEAANVGSGGAASGTPANPQVVTSNGLTPPPAASTAAQLGQTTVIDFRARPGDRFDEADVRELLKKIADATRGGGRVVIAG